MKKVSYKKALYIAAEQMYEREVVDTGMEPLLIGKNGYFSSKKEWIDMQVETWLESATEEEE